jgi:hypothetical protein
MGLIVIARAPDVALAQTAEGARVLKQESRVYADAFALWIYAKPRRSQVPIGYLRGGQSVPLRKPVAIGFEACKRGWYAVEPAGYVCLDNAGSLSPTRYNQAMQTLGPKSGPFPFEFAVSLGTPAYRRVPNTEEENDPPSGREGDAVPLLQADLIAETALVSDHMPWFLTEGGSVARSNESRLVRRHVPAQTLLSLVSRFEVGTRAYYQVADGTLVPAARMKLLRRSTFQGVVLDDVRTLPLAWAREVLMTQRLRDTCLDKLELEFPSPVPGGLSEPIRVHSKCLESGQTRVTERSVLTLTGRQVIAAGATLLETTEGSWVHAASVRVAVAEPAKHTAGKADEKWIHFSIQRGTLVAYEGSRPVFATLASPGNGESNARGARRLTPKGTFRINFKHITDDMSSEAGEHRSEWKADVPYAMYFQQPYGIHVSYWHEAFGDPKSGGCINVSPIDGARLFNWTEPSLPAGWYGVGSSQELGIGTVVHISE